MPKRKTKDKEFQDLTKDIDVKALQHNIQAVFSQFPDPRIRCVYPAWYVILMILCAYLSGCNTIADIAHFVELKTEWINSLLGLSFNTMSYDTIWWFLARVKPFAFKDLLSQWLSTLPPTLQDQLLAIDGKRLKGVSDNEHITHMVELFAVQSRLVIAQESVPDKKCERKALPALLESIDVKGAIISMDAHYAYKPEVELVLSKGADMIFGIKKNQEKLEAEVSNYFLQAHEINYDSEEFHCHTTTEKDHGRIETRHICVSRDLEWLPQRDDWHLKSLIEVRSERILGEKVEKGVLYYGCTREGTPEQFTKWIRGHWGIESLHHIVDVQFQEDASLADAGHAAENISLLRRLCVNLLRIFDPNRGIADARRTATYAPNYLAGLLSRIFVKKC